jgi:hypothetical protein
VFSDIQNISFFLREEFTSEVYSHIILTSFKHIYDLAIFFFMVDYPASC